MKRKDVKNSDRETPKVKPLRIACPKTSMLFTVGFRNDTDWLAKHWQRAVNVRCPRCGGNHTYVIKDVYLSEAIADNQASQDLFAA